MRKSRSNGKHRDKRSSKRNKWRIYEIEKQKISNMGLSAKEYEVAMRKLSDRLLI